MYIADEAMELHYRNMVGLIPLSKSIHEIIHSTYKKGTDKLYIPVNMVYGVFREFIKEYGEYIDDAVYERYKFKIDKTKELTPESFNAIKTMFEYVDMYGKCSKIRRLLISSINTAKENK